MITYKYKLYRTPKTKHLDAMLCEACFVWNHALALQKRYYRIYKKYISLYTIEHHFTKRHKRYLLCAQTRDEILQRLDIAYKRFFSRLSKRPPKFKKLEDFTSFCFRQDGYRLNGNTLAVSKINKHYKFSLSRKYEGKIKRVIIKRNHLGEYFMVLCIDKSIEKLRKSHNGASVGIDFGLKKYLTLSDGTEIDNPQFLKQESVELRRRQRNLSKCVKGSNNYKRKKLELNRLYTSISNKRNAFQWKLAHYLCERYDNIFIEDLNLKAIFKYKSWGRKMQDLAHGDFILKLQYVAQKYGVIVHKIDRYFPSSRLCTCGYKNNHLKLVDRKWTCPECGAVHPRDLFAAQNILRRGIYELGSDCKTPKHSQGRSHVSHPTISLSK